MVTFQYKYPIIDGQFFKQVGYSNKCFYLQHINGVWTKWPKKTYNVDTRYRDLWEEELKQIKEIISECKKYELSRLEREIEKAKFNKSMSFGTVNDTWDTLIKYDIRNRDEFIQWLAECP